MGGYQAIIEDMIRRARITDRRRRVIVELHQHWGMHRQVTLHRIDWIRRNEAQDNIDDQTATTSVASG